VEYTDSSGATVSRDVFRGVEVRPGRKKFIVLRSSL